MRLSVFKGLLLIRHAVYRRRFGGDNITKCLFAMALNRASGSARYDISISEKTFTWIKK
jgi:hypothetical protein